MSIAPLQCLLLMLAGWVNRHQREIVEYLREENRVLREQLGWRRVRFTNAQLRQLAAEGRALGRSTLEQLASLGRPIRFCVWYRELIASKPRGSSMAGSTVPARWYPASATRPQIDPACSRSAGCLGLTVPRG